MNKRIYALLLLTFFFAIGLKAQTTVNITDASLVGGQTYNWTKNNTYVLDGLVFLEDGGVLNIEAGTVIKFTPRPDLGNPSALVIARGSKIFARGTKDAPIIFTAQADDVANPSDLGPSDNSLWGGLVILGKGITQKNGNAEASVEGIVATEPRGLYGGTDNNDDSGVLRYVSLRHGGRLIATGSELNGLTLGAVGSKTILEYIEVYANSDDGIEFFGGAPNLKYAVVAFCEDDCYDWDEVYKGKGQFWFSIQRADIADSAGELDGSTPDDTPLHSNGTVYNWTHIGSGIGAAAGNAIGWLLRAGTSGTIANSIVTAQKGKVIEVQDKNSGNANDAHQRLLAGEIKIANNIFFGNGNNAALDATATGVIRVTSGQPTQDNPTGSDLAAHLVTNLTSVLDPGIRSISRTANAQLDPRPSANGAAYTTPLAALPASDTFFTTVDYKGAFSSNASDLWLAGWSTLARNGHLRNLDVAGTTINITDTSLVGGQTYNWTKNNTYVLDGLVFLEDGGVLNIEAGTVIKFTPRPDLGNPSALVIARGSKIFARGTKDAPIIFTAQADDVANPSDLGPSDNSLWGGLVILGKGITQKNGNAEASVEGIVATEPRGLYGGTDNNDDSGVLRYVSLRHGGRLIATGSELNGLTLGAVGSKTILEYIEVYANSDDGIEFFGGAPNLKYAVVAFCEDDCYDWDEVYKGKGQFWFSIQRADIADSAGELDGSTPDDTPLHSNGTVYNWTHIGSGIGAAAGNAIGWLLRAGTSGTIANSIVTAQKGKVIEVQDKNSGNANDAHQRLLAGEIKIANNIFFGNGNNAALDATATGVIRVTSGQPTQDNPTGSDLAAHLVTNLTSVLDPGIRSISRIQDKKLDPRPSLTGAAYTTPRAALPTNDSTGFFTAVNYKGAFAADSTQLWIMNWTTLARNNHLFAMTTGTEEVLEKEIANNFKIYPNPTPAGSFFTVESEFTEKVRIDIFSLNGSLVRTIPANVIGNTRIDIQSLERGIYVIKFTIESGKFAAKKLIIE